MSEFRLMASTGLQYRHQALALKEYFRGRRCTAMLLDDRTTEDNDRQLQSMASGVIAMEQLAPEFGGARRRLRILKMRGRSYRTGYHDFSIVTGGLEVYPRFSEAVPIRRHAARQLPSGIPGLDELIPGGVDRGTSTMIVGPAGTGKSTLALQYVVAAAARGERSAILAFDEQPATMLARAAGLGIELAKQVEVGLVTIRPIDPAEMSPGEFAFMVRSLAKDDGHGTSIVVIDSVNGYRLGMPEEHFLVAQLHEILVYLAHHDVSTFLILTQHGVIGQALEGPVDATYLADTVILLRHFEAVGAIRQAISVVKRRSGPHERSIREFSLSSGGVSVGPPLLGFRGLLSGFPTMVGEAPEPGV
jgi:circadian clock protein KaiC